MKEIKNLIITCIIVALSIFGWNYFSNKNKDSKDQEMVELLSTEEAIASTKNYRIKITSPKLYGSINLKGLRFDHLILMEFKNDINRDSDYVSLLNPANTENGYFANFGWLSTQKDLKLPNSQAIWTADRHELSPNSPVTLTWDNQEGLIFKIKIHLDQDYMFYVNQVVVNNTDNDIILMPYGLISKMEPKSADNSTMLHQGPLGVFNNILNEISFDKMKKEIKLDYRNNDKGWLGITDKYWLSAIVPDKRYGFDASFNHKLVNKIDRFQVDFLGQKIALPKRSSLDYLIHFFAGAKKINLLDSYEKKLSIDKFDHAIDFGWLYFLTKPFFVALQFINKYTHNFGVAILIFTVIIKLIMLPLSNKSYASITKMKALTPVINRLKEKYKDDKMRFNYELMQLYKHEKVNPLSGCLPLLVQIPVFFALYKVLYITIEMRHAPFFGWIKDLSAPDPTSVLNLFGLAPWNAPSFLQIGAWPMIMGITMYIQQRMNPQPTDPIQAQMMKLMPLIFTVMFYNFPAGLVIYWAWNNILSVAQQYYVQQKVKNNP